MAHRRTEGSQAESPAIRLLDALRNADDRGVLSVCGDMTLISAENMHWSCRGRDEIHTWLQEARDRFPGITFESRTRHIGFGLVIDEARVRDVQPDAAPDADVAEDAGSTAAHVAEGEPNAERTSFALEETDATVVAGADHPMWDEPVTEQRNVMQLWRERAQESQEPIPLNMPVRVTVRHDDLQVHEVSLSFPAALFKRALGLRVDPLEMSLSEVQSAFIAPVGAGFQTYTLARPELAVVPEPLTEPHPELVEPEPPRRRRRRGRVLVPLLLLLAIVGGGAWWALQGREGTPVAEPTPSPSPSASLSVSPSPSASASASVDASVAPTARPTGKPDVVLKSDLAFDINSFALSSQAKADIAKVGRQVRRAGLTGAIYVDGYTDDQGSAASGITLSKKRAEAVASFLSQYLGNAKVTVVAVGHGEADPIASNATAAGQAANRRVTITLPQP